VREKAERERGRESKREQASEVDIFYNIIKIKTMKILLKGSQSIVLFLVIAVLYLRLHMQLVMWNFPFVISLFNYTVQCH
jgi:hypothetical protein